MRRKLNIRDVVLVSILEQIAHKIFSVCLPIYSPTWIINYACLRVLVSKDVWKRTY